jgi:hypothetical protein
MATLFKNKVLKDVGTVPTQVVQTADNARATVIGLSLTNLLADKAVMVSIMLTDETSTTGYFIKDVMIAPNGSLRAVNGGEKLIIAPSNELMVVASADNSVDVLMSYVEIV